MAGQKSVVLIIGNGFDLALNFPTKYTDFLDFTQFVFSIANGNINYAFSRIEKHFEDKDALSAMVQSFLNQIFTESGDKSFANLNNYVFSNTDVYAQRARIIFPNWLENIEDNDWFSYFWEKENAGNRWIDFEAEIASIIQKVDLGRYEQNGRLAPMDSKLSKETGTYLYQSWRCAAKEKTYRSFKEKELTDLKRLIDALAYYLYTIEETIDFKKIELPSFLSGVFEEVFMAPQKYVLNFNYTQTFEKAYYSIYIDNNCRICHIHGENANWQSNNIVLGIDEYLTDEQIQRNVDFAEFRKYYQRIEKDTDSSYLEWLDDLEQSKEVKIIIIGHSLGITDREVLSQFLNCQSNVEVECYYHSDNSRKQQISNLSGILYPDNLIRRITGPHKNIQQIKQTP